MTAKEFLQQYLNAERAINAKLEEISRLRALAMRTTRVPDEDHVFVQSSAGDRMATIVGKIVDMEREVDAEIDELYKVRQRVQDAINSVEDAELRTILIMRYLSRNRYCWPQIAKVIGRNVNTVKGKLHKKALRELTQYIGG